MSQTGAGASAKSGVGRGPEGPESERALARRVIAGEARAVAHLESRLTDDFHAAVGLVADCATRGGSVLVTGLGKSGLIGAKISATLASLGVASHFVHPTEAAHGDLGNFRHADVCIALSYSGETDEVIALAALLRQDGIPVIAFTSGRGGSGLGRVASVHLGIGEVEEAEALSPAPTVSTTAMLALGDALALCASARLGWTPADFAKRHPGGALGARLRPVVEALRFVVGRNLHPVPEGVSVARALKLTEVDGRRPGAMLVVDAAGKLTGLFTDGDLRRLVLRDPALLAEPIERFMTRGPSTLSDRALVADAERLVRESRRDEVPVVDDLGCPVGLLDVQDLVALRVVKA